MQSPQRFSLFLIPCAADFAYLDRLIREICSLRNTSPFEPHMTVYSGSCKNQAELGGKMADAAREMMPIALKIAGISSGPEYFKSLFIAFVEDSRVHHLSDHFRQSLGEDSGYRLMPHLSLLYQDVPIVEKEALARSVVLDRHEILFDTVKIVAPPLEGWRDTAGWRTMFSLRLVGAGK